MTKKTERARPAVSLKSKKTSASRRSPPKFANTERLEEILSIAAHVFMQEGYDRASVGEIARRAGTSKETLYARFPNKEELFTAVITRKTEILLNQFSRVLLPRKSLSKALEDFGIYLLNLMLSPEMQLLNRTLISAAPKFPDLAAKFWEFCPDREQSHLAGYLKKQIARGRLCSCDPREASELFFSLCLGQFLLRTQLLVVRHPSTAEKRTHIREAVRVFLTAYAKS